MSAPTETRTRKHCAYHIGGIVAASWSTASGSTASGSTADQDSSSSKGCALSLGRLTSLLRRQHFLSCYYWQMFQSSLALKTKRLGIGHLPLPLEYFFVMASWSRTFFNSNFGRMQAMKVFKTRSGLRETNSWTQAPVLCEALVITLLIWRLIIGCESISQQDRIQNCIEWAIDKLKS